MYGESNSCHVKTPTGISFIQGNPKRYFTTRDRAKVNSDVMSVRVGLKAFFREHPHLTRRGRRGIYDFV